MVQTSNRLRATSIDDMKQELEGKRIVITGGSMGLGLSMAHAALSAGASVVVCARNSEKLGAAVQELRDKHTGQTVAGVQADVSDTAGVDRIYSETMKSLGGIDGLVLNAGVYGPMGAIESVDIEAWQSAMNINVMGILLPVRRFIPQLKAQGYGKIVVVSGGGATSPLPNLSAYAASKAAAVRLMETISLELKPWNIDVNAIAPGPLVTRLMDEVIAAGPGVVGKEFYLKNLAWKTSGGTPPELGAALTVYLLGGTSRGITGKLISAQWDDWKNLHHRADLKTDIYCLRRIVPEENKKTQ